MLKEAIQLVENHDLLEIALFCSDGSSVIIRKLKGEAHIGTISSDQKKTPIIFKPVKTQFEKFEKPKLPRASWDMLMTTFLKERKLRYLNTFTTSCFVEWLKARYETKKSVYQSASARLADLLETHDGFTIERRGVYKIL